MKKIVLSASFVFAILATSNTFAQQGFGTNQPDRSAAVDIVSSKRGLLIPRISIEDLDQAAPVSNPATSLFVYNTNTTSGEGFYYWDGSKWVRFTSSINEKNVIVTAGDNVQVDPTTSPDGLTTTYEVGVQGGTENGQVLVTKVDGATTTTEWVNPADFIQGINGITVEQVTDPTTGIVENVVKLGGTLTEDTTIITDGNKVMIQGLSQVTDMTDQVVAVGHYQTGEVKVATPGQIVSNTLTDGSGTTAVYDATTGKNQVDLGGKLTKTTVIETEGANTIAITGLEDISATFDGDTHNIVVMGANGVLKITSPKSLIEDAIENGELNAKDLTTDGKIVIGNSASTVTTQADAVLVETQLSIAENSITSEDIQDGTIQPVDIAAPGATNLGEAGDENMVLVTDEDGNVTWVEQSDLANKDNYNFSAPLNKDAGTANTTGGMDYAVTIANANATTVGVVREADTDPTVNVVDGVLSVNLANTTLSGDVTGPLNATVVEAIQGTDVSATAPTAVNNVLVYNDTTEEWTPTELTGSHITGEALTSNSITVTPTSGTTNTALLEELNIEITPGTEGQILTTVNTAAAGDPAVLETDWTTVNSLVEADNGLNKNDTTDKIHLGGDLIEPTEIKTDNTNTLAISGLQPATEEATNKVVVSEGATGILRTVERVVEGTDANVINNSGYSFYTPEVVLNITLPQTGSDVTVNFPNAASAVGQVINIKIANTDETHSTYLNVLNTYGSMPYQGWIVKSNGSEWIIVGRN